MGTIQDFLRGFRRGFATADPLPFATADPLPRVPVACAVVVFLAGILAEGGEAVLCGVIAATFVEVAVLRREVRRARGEADAWRIDARRAASNAMHWEEQYWRVRTEAETPPLEIGRGY